MNSISCMLYNIWKIIFHWFKWLHYDHHYFLTTSNYARALWSFKPSCGRKKEKFKPQAANTHTHTRTHARTHLPIEHFPRIFSLDMSSWEWSMVQLRLVDSFFHISLVLNYGLEQVRTDVSAFIWSW